MTYRELSGSRNVTESLSYFSIPFVSSFRSYMIWSARAIVSSRLERSVSLL